MIKKFKHTDVFTLDEAVSTLSNYGGKARIIAGGTDLLGTMKDEIFYEYPESLVNIKTISGLDYITEKDGFLKIGALTSLKDIAADTTIKGKYTALAAAAGIAASPALRTMGTIGGNICQSTRCWYYRKEGNYFNCLRKGGEICYALAGANRYHSIFGAVSGCVAVNPSDTAPALIALDAKIVTTKKTVDAGNFFAVNGPKSTVLDDDEIMIEIQVPKLAASTKSAFIKFATRKTIDFPIVNCAAAITSVEGTVSVAKICLNAVHNNPYRAIAAEGAIAGKSINESNAEAAGNAVAANASALSGNKYKIQIAKVMVKRAILACK